VACNAPIFQVYRVTGNCYVINPTGNPVACQLAVTPATWSSVKSLYD
jgi:hypothetical protein